MKPVLLAIALTFAFVIACSDDDEGSEVSQSTPVGQALVNLSADEIAATIEGFVEAFANGDTDALSSYLSDTCTPEQVRRAGTAADLFRGAIGQVGEGQYDLTVDADELEFVQIVPSLVRVPLDQPEGVLQATIDGDPVGEQVEPLLVKAPPELVREEGYLRVANCNIFSSGDEEEEEGAGP